MPLTLGERQHLLDHVVTPIWNAITKRMIRTMNHDPAAPCYHYSDANALKSIIETGVLWAGSIRFSNDTLEFEHGRKEILDELNNALNQSNRSKILDRTREMFSLTDGSAIFACCLSYKNDDLEQWRGYGDGGFGYSIGIDYRGLVAQNAKEHAALKPSFSGIVLKVLYKTDNIDTDIIEPLLLGTRSLELSDEESEFVAQTLGVYMLPSFCAAFKHRAFEDEQELRIISSIVPSSDAGYSDVKFRVRNGILLPYKELKLGNGKLPITSITLGPGLRDKAEYATASLEMILDKHDYKSVSIGLSSVPYLP
jgi:hypothetical protein